MELPQLPPLPPSEPQVGDYLPWIQREGPPLVDIRLTRGYNSIVWSEDHQQFVAVGGPNGFGPWNGVGIGGAATSPDGVHWTAWDMPTDEEWDGALEESPTPGVGPSDWTSIAYGNGLYVAVARSGLWQIATSRDGQNWTGRAVAVPGRAWVDVAHGYKEPDGASIWVAVAHGNPSDGFVNGMSSMYSLNGTEWVAKLGYALRSRPWTSIAYGKDHTGKHAWMVIARRELEPGTSDNPTVPPSDFSFVDAPSAFTHDPTGLWPLDFTRLGPAGGGDCLVFNPVGAARGFHSLRYGHGDLTEGYGNPDTPIGFEPLFASNAAKSPGFFPNNIAPLQWSAVTCPFTTVGWKAFACNPETGVMAAIQPPGAALPQLMAFDPGVLGQQNPHWFISDTYDPLAPGAEYYGCIAWGKPQGRSRFVALGGNTSLISDDDGKNWVPNVITGSSHWKAVAFGGINNPNDGDQRRWVVVSERNAPDPVTWSPDGKHWHRAFMPRTEEYDSQWRDVIWDGRRFVAISSSNQPLRTGSTVSWSPDGEQWRPPVPLEYPPSSIHGTMQAIAFDPRRRRYVCVGDTGLNRVLLSTDLAAWRPATGPPAGQYFAMCHGGPAGFVAVGSANHIGGGGTGRIARSIDGDVWYTVDVPMRCTDVMFVDDPLGAYYLAVGDNTQLAERALRSVDGVTWTPMPIGNLDWQGVAWTPRLTVAVANRKFDHVSLDSQLGFLREDGVFWTGGVGVVEAMLGQPFPATMDARAIAAGRGGFTVVGHHRIATCWPTYERPPLVHIEAAIVDVFDVFGGAGWSVFGAPSTLAGVQTVLTDGLDTTWLELATDGSFRFYMDPPPLDGPGVESYRVIVRCSTGGSSSGTQISFIHAILPGVGDAMQFPAANGARDIPGFGFPADRYSNSPTRAGGKAWSPAQFSEEPRVPWRVQFTGGAGVRIYGVTLIYTLEPPEGQRGPL